MNRIKLEDSRNAMTRASPGWIAMLLSAAVACGGSGASAPYGTAAQSATIGPQGGEIVGAKGSATQLAMPARVTLPFDEDVVTANDRFDDEVEVSVREGDHFGQRKQVQSAPTPFNGEHKAGPLAMISTPDASTGLGPPCTHPDTSTTPARCSP